MANPRRPRMDGTTSQAPKPGHPSGQLVKTTLMWATPSSPLLRRGNRGLGHIHIYVMAKALWYLCRNRDHDPSSNRNAYGSQTIQLAGGGPGGTALHVQTCQRGGWHRILIRRITRKGQPCRGKHSKKEHKILARRYPPPAPGRKACPLSTPEEGDLRPFPSLPRVQTPGSSLSSPVRGRRRLRPYLCLAADDQSRGGCLR